MVLCVRDICCRVFYEFKCKFRISNGIFFSCQKMCFEYFCDFFSCFRLVQSNRVHQHMIVIRMHTHLERMHLLSTYIVCHTVVADVSNSILMKLFGFCFQLKNISLETQKKATKQKFFFWWGLERQLNHILRLIQTEYHVDLFQFSAFFILNHSILYALNAETM